MKQPENMPLLRIPTGLGVSIITTAAGYALNPDAIAAPTPAGPARPRLTLIQGGKSAPTNDSDGAA